MYLHCSLHSGVTEIVTWAYYVCKIYNNNFRYHNYQETLIDLDIQCAVSHRSTHSLNTMNNQRSSPIIHFFLVFLDVRNCLVFLQFIYMITYELYIVKYPYRNIRYIGSWLRIVFHVFNNIIEDLSLN